MGRRERESSSGLEGWWRSRSRAVACRAAVPAAAIAFAALGSNRVSHVCSSTVNCPTSRQSSVTPLIKGGLGWAPPTIRPRAVACGELPKRYQTGSRSGVNKGTGACPAVFAQCTMQSFPGFAIVQSN